MNEKTFGEMLLDLSAIPGLRICGSYATGCQGRYSDLDFAATSRRSFDKAVKTVKACGVVLDSAIIGQLSSPRDLDHLPVPIEIIETYWLNETDGRWDSVLLTFGGIESTFKTY